MPFNWKTPSGYLITLLFEFFSFHCADVFIIAVLCFLVGTCFLLKSFIADITNDLHLLSNGKIKTVKQAQRIQKIFCEIAQDLAKIKELSVILFWCLQNFWFGMNTVKHYEFCITTMICRFVDKFNQIHKFVITTFFSWTLLTLCCSFLIIQLELVNYHAIFISIENRHLIVSRFFHSL